MSNQSSTGYNPFDDSSSSSSTSTSTAVPAVDRLAELMASAGRPTIDDSSSPSRSAAFTVDISNDISSHISQYEIIKRCLAEIESNTGRVTTIQQRNKSIVSEKQRREIMAQLDAIMENSAQHAGAIKKQLDSIKKTNEIFYNSHPPNSSAVTMRNNLYQNHIRKFHTAMNNYNNEVNSFKNDLQKRTIRELKIVDSSLTETQIQQIVDSGQANQVISAAMVDENLQETLRGIEERHTEIMKLEKNVREIFELFRDLQMIVDSQQESLDIIENNVASGYVSTKKAEEEIVVAKDYQTKVRKRKCCIILIVLAVIAAIVVLIVVLKTQIH